MKQANHERLLQEDKMKRQKEKKTFRNVLEKYLRINKSKNLGELFKSIYKKGG